MYEIYTQTISDCFAFGVALTLIVSLAGFGVSQIWSLLRSALHK